MIRLLTVLIVFGVSTIVLAQPLYKWVESDGSITFSVTPPPAGISFETVSQPTHEQSPAAPVPPAAQAEKAPELKQALPEGSPVEPAQRLAPQQGVQTSQGQINRNSQQDQQPGYAGRQTNSVMGAPANNAMQNGTPISKEQSAALNARSRKQRQCEDLQKRVVSLERRLKNRLTPDDMDNTVIHMARYQRSYDQHCVQ